MSARCIECGRRTVKEKNGTLVIWHAPYCSDYKPRPKPPVYIVMHQDHAAIESVWTTPGAAIDEMDRGMKEYPNSKLTIVVRIPNEATVSDNQQALSRELHQKMKERFGK